MKPPLRQCSFSYRHILQQKQNDPHQQVVDAGAAIDPQFGHGRYTGADCIAAHGLQQNCTLVGDAFQGGPRNVGHRRAAGYPVMVPRASGFQ
jgi:hypothetical protein